MYGLLFLSLNASSYGEISLLAEEFYSLVAAFFFTICVFSVFTDIFLIISHSPMVFVISRL